MRKTDFTKALTEYFSIYLPTTCGVSPNTTNSYRDTFKQLLLFFQEKKGISANYIELRYLNMELVSEFLDWLETSRHIAVTTRNQRLAAIKAFAHFVQYKFPENIENCVDIINLRPKKYEKALMHLLRAGVNMIYIRDFLGHADISTTEVYARIDAEMKRKVFEEKVPNYTPNTTMPWEEDEDTEQNFAVIHRQSRKKNCIRLF